MCWVLRARVGLMQSQPTQPSQLLVWSWMWGCSSCLLHQPLLPLISALQFTPDQQRLHFTQEFSIFYFLSPCTANPHHTAATRPMARQVVPYTLQAGGRHPHPHQPAWYFRPCAVNQSLECRAANPLLLAKSPMLILMKVRESVNCVGS